MKDFSVPSLPGNSVEAQVDSVTDVFQPNQAETKSKNTTSFPVRTQTTDTQNQTSLLKKQLRGQSQIGKIVLIKDL